MTAEWLNRSCMHELSVVSSTYPGPVFACLAVLPWPLFDVVFCPKQRILWFVFLGPLLLYSVLKNKQTNKKRISALFSTAPFLLLYFVLKTNKQHFPLCCPWPFVVVFCHKKTHFPFCFPWPFAVFCPKKKTPKKHTHFRFVFNCVLLFSPNLSCHKANTSGEKPLVSCCGIYGTIFYFFYFLSARYERYKHPQSDRCKRKGFRTPSCWFHRIVLKSMTQMQETDSSIKNHTDTHTIIII